MADFLAIFDVDGTLVDAQGPIVRSMEQGFVAAGHRPPERRAILSVIGLSVPEMVAALTPGFDECAREAIIDGYGLTFLTALSLGAEPPLYDGVSDAIPYLADVGIMLGVATGKSCRSLEQLILSQNWRRLFVTLQCADHHPSKPHPSMVRHALSETGMAPERAVMIGDTSFDMEMAVAAGIPGIGVDWGYHSAETLRAAGAVTVAPDMTGLIARIEEMAR